MTMSDVRYQETVALTQALISRESITPDDIDCQQLLSDRLMPLGFVCESLQIHEVTNLWAVYTPPGLEDAPLFVFAGHTDVVPPGDPSRWTFPPFEPTIDDEKLYGRGASDMKSGIAAFVIALEHYLSTKPALTMRLGLLITSDEEGPSINGTKAVIAELESRDEQITHCLVGEPSSSQWTGDTIKNGRRGSMTADITIQGKQGHVAYPDQVANPLHFVGKLAAELSTQVWDKGNAFFPVTSFQITDMKGGLGTNNVVPGVATMQGNFRFNTEQTPEKIQARVDAIIDTLVANAEIESQKVFTVTVDWAVSGLPFLTESGVLIDAAKAAVKTVTGKDTMLSTSGGTSDGRFIAPHGAQVVELGVCNATIHQVNEHIALQDMGDLVDIYYELLNNIMEH